MTKQKIIEKIDLINKEVLRIQEHGGDSKFYEELEYIKIKCRELENLVRRELND